MRIKRDTKKEIYYKELGDVTREVKGSHDLLSASWRCREARGLAPVLTWRPEKQGPMV